MYDRGLWILEQYGLTAKTSSRGRGVLLYETEEGWVSIREYGGTRKKLEQQYALMEKLRNAGFPRMDRLHRNQEGELISRDREENSYVLRDWCQGRECDTRSVGDIEQAVRRLAEMHKVMRMEAQEEYVRESLIHECARHNAEIRRTRKFIRRKQKKNVFEIRLLAAVPRFLEKGEEAEEALRHSGYEELREESLKAGTVCHGDYSQHNVLFQGVQTAVTNFWHWNYDMQTADLCHFMRKILEKHNWDLHMGRGMLDTYCRARPLKREELLNLKLRLSYPWKFWKLCNYYESTNKVWISGKNMEKLDQLEKQWNSWLYFLEKAF